MAISLLTRSAGTCTCMRRSNFPILSTETCMSLLVGVAAKVLYLTDHRERSLAGPKAFQARRAAQLLQPHGNLLADSLRRHLHLHAALQLPDTLHGNLHVSA